MTLEILGNVYTAITFYITEYWTQLSPDIFFSRVTQFLGKYLIDKYRKLKHIIVVSACSFLCATAVLFRSKYPKP